MEIIGGAIGGMMIMFAVMPGLLGAYIAKVVDGYEITRAALLAKREPKP